MSNLASDIVNDYKIKVSKGIHEVYYKRDVLEGLKLVVTLIGIGKILFLAGGVLASALGSIISFAGNNPNAARACAHLISKNSDEIGELISSAGEKFNSAYNSLSEEKKKHVRTVILLVAKGGIHWDSLH
jgi:hypothetical protein